MVTHQDWKEEWDERVLLPSAQVMPLLHQQLEPGINSLERPSRAWQDPQVWLEQLQQRPLALPVCPALAPKAWWQQQGLVAVADQPTVLQELWLLLPDDLQPPRAARATLRAIQRRAFRAVARGDGALLERVGSEGDGPAAQSEAVD